jgi:hypothetical protein
MNRKISPKSIFVLTFGLAIVLLAGLGAPIITLAGVNAETLDKSVGLPSTSVVQDNPDVELYITS